MLKLISINIEGDKHLGLILPFLKKEEPDVIYMQEVLEKDVPGIANEILMNFEFVPMAVNMVDGRPGPIGLAIFSKNKLSEIKKDYYCGNPETLPFFDHTQPPEKYREMTNRLLLSGRVEHEGGIYQLATTHFTWTPHGETEPYQLEDFGKLSVFLGQLKEFILAGDLNAPRGEEIYSKLSERYTDDIPEEYKTSLDPIIHRLHNLKQLMVDGLFTTPEYKVSHAHLVSGVSDHEAIVAYIEKDEKNNSNN